MRRDISVRTRTITRYYYLVVACLIAIVVGVFWTIGGTLQYNGVVERSSSPIGTVLHFARTDADLQISDYYTDEARSVLIARIGAVDDSAIAKLPASARDYGVFCSARSFNGHSTVPVLFGRFSTDGDMYLIVPRPTNEIYSFFLMNKNYFNAATDAEEQDESIVSLQNEEESMSKALSQYRYLPASEKQGAVRVQSDEFDVVGFRMTLDPQFTDNAYKVKVLPGTLLSDSGDFDFETFFNAAFKESASAVLEQKYSRLQAEMAAYDRQRGEYESRLKQNPSDSIAENALNETLSNIRSLQNEIDELVSEMQAYSSLTYDSKMFNDIVGEAIVVETE